MNTIYKRTEDGQFEYITASEALAEVNHAMMGGRREVAEMSSSHGNHNITYKDGRRVQLLEVDEAQAAVTQQAPRTAKISWGVNGDVMGKVFTVKGKDYVTDEITPARPRTPGAKSWIPVAYVTYWSMRNGERFGPTRTGSATDKPGTVGHSIWHAALDAANGTR